MPSPPRQGVRSVNDAKKNSIMKGLFTIQFYSQSIHLNDVVSGCSCRSCDMDVRRHTED